MKELVCANSSACEQYCQAMLANGVAVEVDPTTGCNVPEMFAIDAEGATFTPKMAEMADGGTAVAIRTNPELVSKLGGSLFNVLATRTEAGAESRVREELITAYEATLTARFGLWQGMLGAAKANRTFTDAELEYYQEQIAGAETAAAERAAATTAEVVIGARAAADHRTLHQHGLLFDDQMIGTIDRLVGNLMDSKPVLLTGDQGIAKSQAAKFVARMWEPKNEPVLISGHGDMMSNELIGQMEQDKDTRVFAFKEGKLVQAMREGRPVIIDDGNFSDQAVMARTLDILLRRPGDKVILQENGKEPIEIQPGFVVFLTANEASARHLHRHQFTPAYRDRFDVWKISYPDSDTTSPITVVPKSLMRLAFAAAVDDKGVLSPHINAGELEKLTRLAHATQHLYSVPARSARVPLNQGGNVTSSFLDDEPAMTDCITPRALANIVERCAPGNKPNMTIATETERAIKGLDQAGSTRNQTIARRARTLLNA